MWSMDTGTNYLTDFSFTGSFNDNAVSGTMNVIYVRGSGGVSMPIFLESVGAIAATSLPPNELLRPAIINFLTGDFVTDDYYHRGLIFSIATGDVASVPDALRTRTAVVQILLQLHVDCEAPETPARVPIPAMLAYALTPYDMAGYIDNFLQTIVSNTEAQRDGRRLVETFGCDSAELEQFWETLEVIIISRAQLTPTRTEEAASQFEGPGRTYPSIQPTATNVGGITTIEYGEVPNDFVPELPDLVTLKLPAYISMDEKWMTGSLKRIAIQRFSRYVGHGFNSEPWGFEEPARSIIREDYAAVANEDALILICNYIHPSPSVLYENTFWLGSTPNAAERDRLRDRLSDHPLLSNIQGASSQCPASRTEAESMRQRAELTPSGDAFSPLAPTPTRPRATPTPVDCSAAGLSVFLVAACLTGEV